MTTISERRISTEDRRAFPGAILTVVLSATKTNNHVFIAEMECLPGGEPPRHIHAIEDEIFVIKEGTVTFFKGDDIIQAGAGDTVFLPKNVPHHFVITSEKLEVTLIITPGYMEIFFRHLSVPYRGIEIPEPRIPSVREQNQKEDLMSNFEIYYV